MVVLVKNTCFLSGSGRQEWDKTNVQEQNVEEE